MKGIAEPEISTVGPQHSGALGRVRFRFLSVARAPLSQVAGMVGVCSFLAVLFLRKFYIADPDIWWHLATGRGILQHHAVPMTDPFSSYGLGKPWIDYSCSSMSSCSFSIARLAMSRSYISNYWFAWRWQWPFFILSAHCFRASGERWRLPASPCMR